MFDAPIASQKPHESWLYEKYQEQHVSKSSEQDPERVQARTSINQGNAKSEKNPSYQSRLAQNFGVRKSGIPISPTTSFATPAERVMTPTFVSRSLSSVRIRHRTGKA